MDHLSRVTRCAFGKTVAQLADVLAERTYVEGPLETYAIGEATVVVGMIFGPKGRIQLSHLIQAGLGDVLARAPLRDRVVLANSQQGLRYFGHWLSDDVSAFEAFREDGNILSVPLPDWEDVAPYVDLFDQQWKQNMVYRTRSLTLVRDLGFGIRKSERYRTLRNRLRKRTNAAAGRGKIIFLRRGPSGAARDIVNAPQLEQRLWAAGVSIVTAEGGKDLIKSILDASIIITVEGSQDRHALYALRDRGGVVTLAPPERFYIATHEWARNLDMHSGVVIGHAAKGGFRIDPDEVLSMVDRLLALSENREAV
ncbi:glycosyltransferase 61 family protein [Paracoccus sp. AK26]|uniref:glycosyltransferase 61 family protein n=1 Tax=Paracoccus sp. AK26 TaxID=2589076 RepID=UPI001430F750|nr:glycosyltransferase 61 family protein [Paracoccus sp. AK26]